MNTLGHTSQVFAYGCPPAPQPQDTPWWPGFAPKPWRLDPEAPPSFTTPVLTLNTCERCGRHCRIGEPCPFCLKDDLERLERRIDDAVRALNGQASLVGILTAERNAKRKPRKRKKKK